MRWFNPSSQSARNPSTVRRVVAVDAHVRRITDAIAPHRAAPHCIARRVRFTLIHYIKQLTVYREPALFLVMPRCFMRRPPICETAPSPLIRSLPVLARLNPVYATAFRSRRRRRIVPHACKPAHARKHVSMHRDRVLFERSSADNENREIII